MCRNVDHGGRRCPSSHLEGERLEAHLQRKRQYYARKKAADSWAKDNDVPSEDLKNLSPMASVKWAMSKGAQPSDIGMTPDEIAAAYGLLPRTEWDRAFKSAATGDEIRKIVEESALTEEEEFALREYGHYLDYSRIIDVLQHGDGEDYGSFDKTEFAEYSRRFRGPFAIARDWLRESPVGRIIDGIFGVQDFFRIFKPLTAPIVFMNKIRLRDRWYLDKVRADALDGALFDLDEPLFGKISFDEFKADEEWFGQVNFELFMDSGQRVGLLKNGAVVVRPGSKVFVREVIDDGDNITVRGDVFNSE